MGVERVDYYSDDEYQQALHEEQLEAERSAEESYMEYIQELDYSVEEAKKVIGKYDPEQVKYLLSLYCSKCGRKKPECVCNEKGKYTESDLPF